jgi:hypothetical protein
MDAFLAAVPCWLRLWEKQTDGKKAREKHRIFVLPERSTLAPDDCMGGARCGLSMHVVYGNKFILFLNKFSPEKS